MIDEETDYVLNLGVEFRGGQRIDSMKALLAQDWDAIFVGTGALRGRDLDLPGRKGAAANIHIGIDWLSSVSFGHVTKIGKRVIVLGGGNTAMDCCRSSRRLGGDEVQVVVRSGFDEMKASPWEKEDAMHEGIPIHNFLVPKEFTHDNGKLTGVVFEKVKAELDAKGRRKLVNAGEPDQHFPCDDVLVAVGQENAFPWIERDAGIDSGGPRPRHASGLRHGARGEKQLGDAVKKGDVLAILDSREFAELQREAPDREGAARRSRRQLQARRRRSGRRRSPPRRTSSPRSRRSPEAKIEHRSAAQKLHASSGAGSRAPRAARTRSSRRCDGTIIEKHISVGEVLRDDTQAFVVADLSTIWVNVTVYAKDLARVRAGQTARVRAEGVESPRMATITYVGHGGRREDALGDGARRAEGPWRRRGGPACS